MMGTGSKKVLVIDDDLSVRQAVRLSLSHQGCKVSDTDNAESGFEMALLQQPDLVISDVNMQGISGLALLSKLRSNPATSAIPVILMTGAPDSASVRCSMEHGADDYLPKPFSHSVLIAAVRARLERQESLLSSAKANEDRLLGLLSATRDMVALVDPSTQRLLYLNPAGRELAGFGPDEDISQVQMDAFLKDAPSASLAEKLNHVRQQGFWRGESEIAQKHGGRIPASEQIMAHVQEGTSGCYWSIVARDISDRKRAEMELAKVHRELLKTSRMAGMAEVANGVLHNVKNALNSINIASTCLAESIRKSNSDKLSKIVELFRQHESNLALFLTTDAKGMQIPGYLAQLADRLQHEQQSLLEELARLQKGIEHIKSVVVAQQNTARTAGRAECVKISELVHESLELSSLMESGHGVQVVLDLNPEDYLTTDRQKVVQILLNLLGNAKQACEESQKMENTVTIRGRITENRLRIEVIDTGVGIAPEHLERIFSHGFTTKANGHGFGLHSSLLTAKELGGMLRVDSKGINQGAVFTLELPV